MKINVCKKICKECAFNGNTKDTLYAEALHIMEANKIFPCHSFLRKVTGSENTGTESLNEVRVCRGYVAYMKKHDLITTTHPQLMEIWTELLSKISKEELDSIISKEELINNHKHLRNNVYLGN